MSVFQKGTIQIEPLPVVNPSDISPWFSKAKSYVGEKELTGNNDGPFVADCFKAIGSSLRQDKWCAAFVGRCLIETGCKSTRSPAAFSYTSDFVGKKCDAKPGAVVVIEHQNGNHHVAFFDHWIDDHYYALLGGNQDNSVCVKMYDNRVDKIISCHWPEKA